LKPVILLLVENDVLRERLHGWLADSYDIYCAPQTRYYNLCVVDSAYMRRVLLSPKRPWLARLLLHIHTDPELSPWQQADDFITVRPDDLDSLRRDEFQARLARLQANETFKSALGQVGDDISLLSYILYNMPVMFNVVGEDRLFKVCNRECERVTGYTADEIINNPQAMSMLYPNPDYLQDKLRNIELRQGNYRDWEWDLVTRSGEVRTVAWFNETGAAPVEGWWGWGVGVDVTERNHARAAEYDALALAQALRDTATLLTSTLDMDEVFERILTNVGRVVEHDAANIMLIEGELVRVMHTTGYDDHPIARHWRRWAEYPLDKTINLKQIFESRRPMVVNDVSNIRWRMPGDDDWIRSLVTAPILLQQQVIGFINLQSLHDNFFTPLDADRLQAFAEQAAIAIQNARLYQQGQVLAVLRERQRLARDLHDAVSQTLFSATLIAEALPRQIDSSPEWVEQHLHELHRLLKGAHSETRTLLLELRPDDLLNVRLDDLLRQLATNAQSRKRLVFEFTISLDPDPAPEVKTMIYRVAQEAITNIVKHAGARRVRVQLTDDDSQLELTIADDGCGFDLGAIPVSIGLNIMRERAAGIGATLVINSQPGQGTSVRLTWHRQQNREN
jgi:PAS domain S-box-containing protein